MHYARCTINAQSLTRPHLVSRSSSKLQTLLLERKIPQSTIDAHLNIIQGDVHDLKSVSQTLAPPSSNRTADLIISGIGLPPIFKPNPISPATIADPTICQDAISTILTALRGLPFSPQKPLLVALSSTGISSRKRDVPIAMMVIYHWLASVPHKDKTQMEAVLLAEMAKSSDERAIKDFVILRPSFLTDGKRLGTAKVRVGVESAEAAKPAVGYKISREDVGGWMFDKIVNGNGGEKFAGKMVSITY